MRQGSVVLWALLSVAVISAILSFAAWAFLRRPPAARDADDPTLAELEPPRDDDTT